jgi:hypothetical protein
LGLAVKFAFTALHVSDSALGNVSLAEKIYATAYTFRFLRQPSGQLMATVFVLFIVKYRRRLGRFTAMDRQSIRPFRFFQRDEIVLGEDQPMFFQLPIMTADSTGRSLSLAGTLLRSLCELFNLFPEVGQHRTTLRLRENIEKMADCDYVLVGFKQKFRFCFLINRPLCAFLRSLRLVPGEIRCYSGQDWSSIATIIKMS